MIESYILIGDEPVRIGDIRVYGLWSERYDRRVAETVYEDGTRVSTVFLCIPSGFGGDPPLVFETMIFRDWEGREQWNCATWSEALEQHEEAKKKVACPSISYEHYADPFDKRPRKHLHE